MKTKMISFTGMLAAIIFVLTMFVKIPVPIAQGYVHLGDAIIYLGALVFDAPYIFIAAAVGEGLADLAGGFPMYIPATVIIKCLIAVPFVIVKKNQNKLLSLKSVLMTVVSGAITVMGYFFYEMIFYNEFAVVDIPFNIIQAVGSAIVFIILAAVFDKSKLTERINLR